MDYDFDLDNMKPDDLLLPPDIDPDDERTLLPFVQFLQPMSTLKGYPKGQANGYIAVGRNEVGADGKAEWKGVLLEGGEARFWMIDHLTTVPDPNKKFRGKPQRLGARSMWPFDPATAKPSQEKNADGSAKASLCGSKDGLAPIASYLNTAVKLPANHPGYPGVAIIGFGNIFKQGEMPALEDLIVPEADMVCRTCPLGAWYEKTTPPVNGKKKEWERLCKSKWNFVVYFPPQKANVFTEKAKKGTTGKDLMIETVWEGGIAILQGHSPSVQSALEGNVAGGTVQKTKDNQDIPSIFNFMTPNGNTTVVVPKEDLHPSLLKTALAFGPDAENLTPVNPENIEADVRSAMADENVKLVQIETKTYPYAVNGHPQIVGKTTGLAGLRYLQINVVQSAWNNNPFVPFMAVSDIEVDEADYDAWLDAIRFYKGEGLREQLLLTDNLQVVKERLANPAGLLASGENAPRLSDGAIEGEIADLDDM